MIRISEAPAASRRQLLRMGFLGIAGLAATEFAVALAPFLRVTRVSGLGLPVRIPYPKAELLRRFAESDDDPILFAQGRFFLMHPPGGIIAAYRKCTHLGCAVPFAPSEDRFHCPCHGSIFDKRTAVVMKDPAPKPLQLFHIREDPAGLVVDTNPLNVIDRPTNLWDPAVIEVRD